MNSIMKVYVNPHVVWEKIQKIFIDLKSNQSLLLLQGELASAANEMLDDQPVVWLL